MSRYKLAPEVRGDLKEICRYIARDSPDAAGRLRSLFFERFRLLARHPLIGEARDDLTENLRIFPVGNYIILYRPMSAGIEVVQVVHAARDIDVVFRKPDRKGS
jgi:toxin ParE1/3/4